MWNFSEFLRGLRISSLETPKSQRSVDLSYIKRLSQVRVSGRRSGREVRSLWEINTCDRKEEGLGSGIINLWRRLGNALAHLEGSSGISPCLNVPSQIKMVGYLCPCLTQPSDVGGPGKDVTLAEPSLQLRLILKELMARCCCATTGPL